MPCYKKQANRQGQSYAKKGQAGQNQEKQRQRECYQCGRPGHLKADCKVPQHKWIKKNDGKKGNFKGNSRGGRPSGQKGRQFTKQTLEENEQKEEEEEGQDEYSDHFLDKMLAEQQNM